MVKKNKGLFWEIGLRHAMVLVVFLLMSIVLNEIVIQGNDYIADATDSMFMGQEVNLQSLLLPLSCMIVVGTVVAYLAKLSRAHYSSLVQRDVREDLARHLLDLPYSYFDEKGSGSVLTKFSSDIAEAGKFFSEILPELLVDIVTVGTITIYFVQMDVRLILILFASYPVMMLVSDKLSKRLATILRKFRTTMDDRTQVAYDAIQGIVVGRSYNLYNTMCARINKEIDKIANHACKSTRISSMGWVLKGVITTIPVVVCYFFALFEVILGRITIGDLLAFTVLLSRVTYPLGNIMFCMNDIRASKVALDRLETLYRIESEERIRGTQGELETVSAYGQGIMTESDVEINESRYDEVIVWDKVRFAYASSQTPVLSDVSFSIKKGEMVAFVGGSGEGKSTIFRLLCGLYEKQAGGYSLFWKNIEKWTLRELRECFSVVSQNVFLLPQSIGENVACGKTDATKEEIVEACKAADIHDFIMSLPQGYDTQVGERGVKLSGGQKQRISIARAFLKDAPIILLDEPTSAVDVDTEGEIQKAITTIAKDKTVIVIAHRLSTIQNADCIYVLSGGTIAESGSHQELMEQNGIYAKLYGKEVSGREDEK